MPLEVLTGNCNYDILMVDLYSIGTVIAECLLGENPFLRAETLDTLIWQKRNFALKGFSLSMCQIVNSLMSDDIRTRLVLAESFLRDMDADQQDRRTQDRNDDQSLGGETLFSHLTGQSSSRQYSYAFDSSTSTSYSSSLRPVSTSTPYSTPPHSSPVPSHTWRSLPPSPVHSGAPSSPHSMREAKDLMDFRDDSQTLQPGEMFDFDVMGF